MNWKKHSKNPLIEADENYYELLNSNSWKDQAWRDPWVFQLEGSFHAFITARVKYGSPDGGGVIAHAESNDLINWSVGLPVIEPGEFGQLEIPQLIHVIDKYYLFFNTYAESHSHQRLSRANMEAVTGTYFLVADEPLGPFKFVTDQFVIGDIMGTLYNGKMIQSKDGRWCMMACQNFSDDGKFVGIITDPFEVNFLVK